MSHGRPSTIAELPQLAEQLSPAAWAADLVAGSRALLRAGVGVLADGDGGVVVLSNAGIRALAENPAVGNAPVEYLTGRAAERVHRATGTAAHGNGTAPGPMDHFLRNQVFTMNPPVHTSSRRLIARYLTPRSVRGMAALAEEIVGQVLREALSGGEVDLGRDVAGRFVTRFWTRQLGMPAEDAARVQDLVHEMNGMFLLAPTPEDSARVRRATAEYMALVAQAVTAAERRGDDALAQLAADLDELGVPGGPDDFGAMVASNFFDGFHTVGVALTNAAVLLLSEPESLARVRADPGLVPRAFTEGTRLAAPLMLTTRMTLEDVEHDGLHLPAGTPVTMIWIAGNLDPEAFDDPDVYSLDRVPRAGTTFGGGIHICPGRSAARMLGEVGLRALTAAGTDVELTTEDHAWLPGSGMRQLTASPVRLRRTHRP